MLYLLTDHLIQCMSDTYANFASNPRKATEKCLHLFSYKAHAMGANTVSTIELTNQSRSSRNVLSSSVAAVQSTVAVPLNAEGDTAVKNMLHTHTNDPPSWSLMITSGGDDQAISVCNATLRLQNQEVNITSFFMTDSFLI